MRPRGSHTIRDVGRRRLGLGAVLQRIAALVLAVGERGLHIIQRADSERASTRFLKANYAPAGGEYYNETLQVEGVLPKDLDGLFARVGPNPLHISGDYHWFDGDGFIHAVRISNGKATGISGTWVKTSKFKQEKAAGRALFTKFGDLRGPCLLGHVLIERLREAIGILDSSQGSGTANTALVFHGGALLALQEGDQPYELFIRDDGRVDTVGRVFKGGQTPSSWFTAHPKVHSVDGCMYAYGYSLSKKPYASFYRVDPEGNPAGYVELDFKRPVMMHDMGVTENYAILPEASLCFKLGLGVLLPRSSLLKFNHKKPTRFCILPLNAKDNKEARWFELPPSFLFHFGACWEERKRDTGGKLIRSFIIRYDTGFDLRGMKHMDPQATLQEIDRSGLHLWEYTFDLETGKATQRRVINHNPYTFEFPTVNPRTVGSARPTRYLFTAVFDRLGRPASFAKIDLKNVGQQDMKAVKMVSFGDSESGGEMLFVPKKASVWGTWAEDDGYLLVYTHNDTSNQSEFRVYDAKTMDATPLARVRLPRRVPYGFHTVFVPESDIKAQASSNAATQQPPPAGLEILTQVVGTL